MKRNMATKTADDADTIEIPDEAIEAVARALVRFSWGQFEEQPSTEEEARGAVYVPNTPNRRCREAARAAIEAMLHWRRNIDERK